MKDKTTGNGLPRADADRGEEPARRHHDRAHAVGHRESEDTRDEQRRRSDRDPEGWDERREHLSEQELPGADRRRQNRLQSALAFLPDDRVRREDRGDEDRKK